MDLYSKLQNANLAQHYLKNTVNEFSETVKEECSIKQISNEEMKAYQKRMIESHAKNSILLDSLRRKKTIEAKIDELYDNLNKGIWKYLPKRKNEQQNHEIEQMMELVGAYDGIRRLESTHMIDLRNNVINYPIFCGIMMGTLITACHYFGASDFSNEPLIPNLLMIEIATIIPTGLLSIVVTPYRSEFKEVKEKARYIDQKIEELF